MNEDSISIEQVEDWLSDKLSKEDKEVFEKKMESDADFAKEVTLIKDLILSIRYSGQEHIRETIKQVDSNLDKNNFFNKNDKNIVVMENKTKRNNSIWIMIAASLLLIVAFFMYQNGSEENNTSDGLAKVFAKYNIPEKTILPDVLDRLEAKGLANDDKNANDSLANALKLFENFKYEEAKTQLYKFLEIHPENKTAQLYMGLSLFSMGKYTKSSEYLSPLVKDKEFKFINTAKWYLALSLTQFGTDDANQEAKTLMQELASNNTRYHLEANDYLQYLK